MRLGRLAVAGLAAGVVAGFAVALLRPRRRPVVLDLTGLDPQPPVESPHPGEATDGSPAVDVRADHRSTQAARHA
ncbi:hypothetical protein ACIB24_02900 [Spongisporangium articulatum]|uniref:Uncharacterized protein n=1 Tax=Spongisporangium articulatum TaxID=3362603 RepID=A0ABW8AI22_9ACTN